MSQICLKCSTWSWNARDCSPAKTLRVECSSCMNKTNSVQNTSGSPNITSKHQVSLPSGFHLWRPSGTPLHARGAHYQRGPCSRGCSTLPAPALSSFSISASLSLLASIFSSCSLLWMTDDKLFSSWSLLASAVESLSSSVVFLLIKSAIFVLYKWLWLTSEEHLAILLTLSFWVSGPVLLLRFPFGCKKQSVMQRNKYVHLLVAVH